MQIVDFNSGFDRSEQCALMGPKFMARNFYLLIWKIDFYPCLALLFVESHTQLFCVSHLNVGKRNVIWTWHKASSVKIRAINMQASPQLELVEIFIS